MVAHLKSVLVLSFALLGSSGIAGATSLTVGNPLVNGGSTDSCGNCSYVVGQTFGTAGLSVSSFSFYSGSTSGDVLPLLFTGVTNPDGTTTFTVTGVGTDEKVSATGLQTYSFGLTSGSNITAANTYFGFANLNGSAVSYSYNGNASNGGTFLEASNLSLGSSFTLENTAYDYNTQNALNNREYSIQATAVSATPEPGSFVLLGTGIVGMAGMVRRRIRRS